MEHEYYEEIKFKEKSFTEETVEDCEFVECEFETCTFEACTVIRCRFIDCKFHNCSIISPHTKHSEIKRGEFIDCNLIGVHWNELLPAGKISEPIRKLENCCLKYNSFVDMSLRSFDFSGNIIQESIFEECNLMESKFTDCRLEAAQISNCDIRGTDFRGAVGYQIDMTTNRMKDARFSFPEAVSLLHQLGIKID